MSARILLNPWLVSSDLLCYFVLNFYTEEGGKGGGINLIHVLWWFLFEFQNIQNIVVDLEAIQSDAQASNLNNYIAGLEKTWINNLLSFITLKIDSQESQDNNNLINFNSDSHKNVEFATCVLVASYSLTIVFCNSTVGCVLVGGLDKCQRFTMRI